jgi:nicotinamide phosphoribosyltransferase
MKINPLTMIDGYKADHRRQYPVGTESVYSNFTPRSTKHLPQVVDNDGKVVFFGLQFFIKDFLIDAWTEGFFKKDRATAVVQYKRRLDNYLGPDAVPVDHIGELHDMGFLPLSVRALPEGTVVNPKTPVFVIHETHKKFYWLVNYLESIISDYVWKPCTSATIARIYKKQFVRWAKATGSDEFFTNFQGHDFSFRGMSGIQDAVTSGAGHLLSFLGTDTIPAIDFLEDYYGANSDKEMIGVSVPATEHSVMCMGGELDEYLTFKRLITELYPKGIVSIVSDTWDFWNVCKNITAQLKTEIMARDGKVVLRPDSGDPVKIICGYKCAAVEDLSDYSLLQVENLEAVECDGKFYLIKDESTTHSFHPEFTYEEVDECVVDGAIVTLWKNFGGTTTSTGHKLLDSHIGLIYGDSITIQRSEAIFAGLAAKGFASGNIVLGIGLTKWPRCVEIHS